MLIFNHEEICRLASSFEQEGSGALQAGQENAVCIALINGGSCIVSGQPQVRAAAGCVSLTPGQTIFMPDEGCRLIGAVLSGIPAKALCAQLASPLLLSSTNFPKLPETLYRLCGGDYFVTPEQQSALGYTLLCLLAAANKSKRTSLSPLVAEAAQEIREHYAEVYGVDELAAQLGVSKGHLIRSFSAAMGMPPGRYLSAVRLDAAKRLLLHREYSLEVVAGMCGFSCANYLCKVFKKETGCSPAAWRALNASSALAGQDAVIKTEERMFL